MIIIEGPDLVGKTTLAKKLLEKLPSHIYAHFTRLPPRFDNYRGYLDRASRFVVQDRFHMSAPLYARMRGDDKCLCPETYRLVDGYLRTLGVMTVVITASEELIQERTEKNTRGEMYSAAQIWMVNDLFYTMVKERGRWNGYDMDYDVWTECSLAKPWVTDEEVAEILARYDRRQNRWERLH